MVAFIQGIGPAELLVLLLMLGIFGFWIWAIIEVTRRTDLDSKAKALWLFALLLLGPAAALVYGIVKLVMHQRAIREVKEP